MRLAAYLEVLESRLFSSGLHTLGQPPDQEQRLAYLKAYVGDALPEALLEAISRLTPALAEPALRAQAAELECLAGNTTDHNLSLHVLDALRVCQLLERCTEEIDHLLDGLGGQYIPPAPGVIWTRFIAA